MLRGRCATWELRLRDPGPANARRTAAPFRARLGSPDLAGAFLVVAVFFVVVCVSVMSHHAVATDWYLVGSDAEHNGTPPLAVATRKVSAVGEAPEIKSRGTGSGALPWAGIPREGAKSQATKP